MERKTNGIIAISLFLVSALVVGTAVAQSESSDAKFLKKAAVGNMLEIQLGQMAEKRAGSDAVIAFGRLMQKDHSKVLEKIRSLAEESGIDLPTRVDNEHQGKMEVLSAKQGEDFDQAYMDFMIEEHQKDIEKFAEQEDTAENPKIRQFAEATLPDLKKHLEKAKQVEADL